MEGNLDRIVCTLNLYDNGMHKGARASQQHAAIRWGARYVELTEPLYPSKDPFIEKLSLEQRFGHARVIFFDRDVVVRSDCPNLFEIVPEGNFAAVPSEQEGHKFLHEICPSINPLLIALGLSDTFDYERDYFNSGMLVFDLPTHQQVFVKARALMELTDCREWEVYDQGLLAVAVQATFTPFLSLDHSFNRCGERLWRRWQPEMTEFVWHFCNMNNPEFEINSTQWHVEAESQRHVV